MRAMSFRTFQKYCKERDADCECLDINRRTYRIDDYTGWLFYLCTARACPVWGKCKEIKKARGK